ncbi:CD48 antigen-like [Halichoeres trimaculatus]|uniref:CD48 antigen-like n=1 Tax=Halichoeres trimaculatus TaxID=147232 RepID=UPI003D9F8DD0
MRYSLKSLGYFAVFLSLVFANAPKKQYSAKGGDAVLNPHYKGSTITSMEWKHGSDLAAEWYGEDPACLHNFKGRCKLNTSTGALTITGLDGSENGIFSVAINDKQIDTKISLVVISKVPKPTISSDCDTTHCTLTCAGNTTDAEPVDCTWFTGDAETGSGMELEITKETKEESFTCMLQNPVSSERSESLPNPIMMKDQRNRMISIIVPIVVILVLVALIVLIAFVVIRKRNGRSFDLNWFRERAARGTKEANNVMLLNGEAVLPQPNVTGE